MKTGIVKPTPEINRLYTKATLLMLLAAGVFSFTATAQGERPERGGGIRQSTRRDAPGRDVAPDRRNDVTFNRDDNRGSFDRNQSPANIPRNFDRSRPPVSRDFNPGRNNAPDFNRDRPVTRDFNPGRNNAPQFDRQRPGNRDFAPGRNFNRDFNRNNNGFAGRPAPYNRPGFATASRPGYRPVYGYNRNPVYNPYSPSWRYSFLPRRNSFFYNVPSSYININFGGIGYRYCDGVFYRPYNNLFSVIAPPVGIYINVLPIGYRRIVVHDYPYYYYNGTYYDQRGSDYYVVSPPEGAVVESLPEGYETVVIDGETYYTVDGAQYKPVIQENGEIWYEVIKAN